MSDLRAEIENAEKEYNELTDEFRAQMKRLNVIDHRTVAALKLAFTRGSLAGKLEILERWEAEDESCWPKETK